ncbi:TspO/MBR family protein [Allosphingosinicella sp.]|uniref:TspO/MBR family protein n=1 Tax=Allosphingosinicella sp. TaxID=2823234 RepID=UPI00378525FC
MSGLASRSELRMSFLRYAVITVPAIVLLGTLSGFLSNSGYSNPWFDALRKPGFMPPGWAFGVAWTILYILIGISLAMLLHAKGARKRERAIILFGLMLAINLAWSPVFFGMHKVTFALGMIAAMIVLTASLILILWRIRIVAALLLYPYLGWLMFAGLLNYEILRLNPNAETLVPEQRTINIDAGGNSADIR